MRRRSIWYFLWLPISQLGARVLHAWDDYMMTPSVWSRNLQVDTRIADALERVKCKFRRTVNGTCARCPHGVSHGDIAVIGFPRSGNWTLSSAIRFTGEHGLRVLSHSHDVTDIQRCIEAHVPAVVPFREPHDTVASFMVYSCEERSAAAAKRLFRAWCIWHEMALSCTTDSLVQFVPFAEITSNLRGVLNMPVIAKLCTSSSFEPIEFEIFLQGALGSLDGQGSNSDGRSSLRTLSTPQHGRQQLLDVAHSTLEMVLRGTDLERTADLLYNALLARSQGPA